MLHRAAARHRGELGKREEEGRREGVRTSERERARDSAEHDRSRHEEERANNVITFDGSPETIRTSQIVRSRAVVIEYSAAELQDDSRARAAEDSLKEITRGYAGRLRSSRAARERAGTRSVE